MRRLYRPILLLCFVSFWIACQKPSEDPTVIVTTKPEFVVDLFEQIDPLTGNPTFGLWIRSVEKFSCSNYRIEGNVLVAAGDVRIQLKDVSPPDTCVGNAAVAQTFLPIGKMLPGSYRFSLTLGSAIQNEGILNVYEDRCELSLTDPQGVDFQNLALRKIPSGLVWGYILTPDDASVARAADFLADLKNLTTEHALEAGFYSYFTLSGTGLLLLHPGFAPTSTSQLFVRQAVASPEALKTLIQQYRSTSQTPLQIRFLTTSGEL